MTFLQSYACFRQCRRKSYSVKILHGWCELYSKRGPMNASDTEMTRFDSILFDEEVSDEEFTYSFEDSQVGGRKTTPRSMCGDISVDHRIE